MCADHDVKKIKKNKENWFAEIPESTVSTSAIWRYDTFHHQQEVASMTTSTVSWSWSKSPAGLVSWSQQHPPTCSSSPLSGNWMLTSCSFLIWEMTAPLRPMILGWNLGSTDMVTLKLRRACWRGEKVKIPEAPAVQFASRYLGNSMVSTSYLAYCICPHKTTMTCEDIINEA